MAGCFKRLGGVIAAAAAVLFLLPLPIAALFGIRPCIVMSGSMEPALPTGSLCFVDTRADFGDVRSGEIIVYETAGGLKIIHRAVGFFDGRIETKGDANRVSDGFAVNAENFYGKNRFTIPYVGYVCAYLQNVRQIIVIAVCLSVFLRQILPKKRSFCNMHKKD